jgi:hypothetical protein
MKFNILLEELLNELTGEEIHKKFYSKLPYEDFLKIVSMDPQTRIGESGRIEKLGKYSRLLLTMYSGGGFRMEDSGKVREYTGYLYQHNIPVDVKKVKSIGDLYNIVKEYIIKDTKDFSEILKVLDKSEYEFLYDGKDWFIFKPLTEKASCYLGVNTQWCTTYGEHSLSKEGRGRISAFSTYNKPGDQLYILINKKNYDDKYQLHFGTAQYMNPSDQRIDVRKFFRKNEDWLRYFFPSLYGEVSKEQLNMELKRIDVLDKDLSYDIVSKAVEGTDNDIIIHLMNEDSDSLVDFMDDNDILEIDFYSGKLELRTRSLYEDAQNLSYVLSHYQHESRNGSEFVYDDLRSYFDDHEELKVKLETDYFSKFYKQFSNEIRQKVGIQNYETFKKYYFDNYVNNEKVKEALIEDITDLSSESYERYFEEEVKNIESFIEFNSSTMDIDISRFVVTLLKHDIKSIGENGISLWDCIDLYISDNNLPTEYEGYYNYEMTYPVYGEYNEITKVTENYLEEVLDEDDSEDCRKYRDMLDTVVSKFFKKVNYGFFVYEDDNIMVMLKSLQIDCSEGTVSVVYQNKQTGKTYGANNTPDGVKVENLVSLVNNYKLFESIINFKKNII